MSARGAEVRARCKAIVFDVREAETLAYYLKLRARRLELQAAAGPHGAEVRREAKYFRALANKLVESFARPSLREAFVRLHDELIERKFMEVV